MRTHTRKAVLSLVAVALVGCATVPLDVPKTETHALAASTETTLGNSVQQWSQQHNGQSGFFPLVHGLDALGARLDLIEKAERSIDLQYFLMKGDTAGLVISRSLIAAADRGVRVRFLLDDVFTTVTDHWLLLLDEHPNIEVRLFNPVSRRGFYAINFAGSFRRANRRMHNKSFTVDNAASIVGGRNIADEYFELQHDAVFADFDLLALGPISSEISRSFDTYWNHKLAIPLEFVAKREDPEELQEQREQLLSESRETYDAIHHQALSSEVLQELIGGRRPVQAADARVIVDDPDKLLNPVGEENMVLARDVDQILRKAEKELLFISPYYVPGRDGVEYVKALVDKGLHVTIVTNSLASNNHVAVHSAYSGYRKDVLDAGVELYEVRSNAGKDIEGGATAEALTLHTKLILIDRRYLFVGSLNLDPRSLEINAEMGLIIDSPVLANALVAGFMQALPTAAYKLELDEKRRITWKGEVDGASRVETSEPNAGLWLRFKAWVLKVAPESQL